MIARLVSLLERLGGARPWGRMSLRSQVALGLWWFALFCAICATIGRATKFIYVDF